MREIKFRAWDKYYKEYRQLSLTFGLSVNISWLDRKEDFVMQQYTGLKDKNGKEIYEGDILQCVTNYYGNRQELMTIVAWQDDIENDSFGEPFTSGYLIRGGEWEVMGNIYENPELLK